MKGLHHVGITVTVCVIEGDRTSIASATTRASSSRCATATMRCARGASIAVRGRPRVRFGMWRTRRVRCSTPTSPRPS